MIEVAIERKLMFLGVVRTIFQGGEWPNPDLSRVSTLDLVNRALKSQGRTGNPKPRTSETDAVYVNGRLEPHSRGQTRSGSGQAHGWVQTFTPARDFRWGESMTFQAAFSLRP